MSGWLVNLVAVPYGLWIAWVGVQHFRDPSWFEPIVPGVIGNARFWVYASGAFEIILGIGLLALVQEGGGTGTDTDADSAVLGQPEHVGQ